MRCGRSPNAPACRSSTSPATTRRTAPAPRPRAASAWRTGLAILNDVREATGLPVLTDVHAPDQCAPAAQAVDVLQIPAFLCRQTDLLLAAGETGRAINVKKGQFLAPWDMVNVAAKIASTGNHNILLCERGASFGYNTLVSDMRSLPIMARTGYPVVFDATHSVQQPGGQGTSSGGQREFAPVLARAALAVGVAAVFIETHPDPDQAPSDGPNMIPLRQMEALVTRLAAFDRLAKQACDAGSAVWLGGQLWSSRMNAARKRRYGNVRLARRRNYPRDTDRKILSQHSKCAPLLQSRVRRQVQV